MINGLSEIYNKYNHLVIDLWGVLHDGYAPYKGAIEALTKLKQANKQVVLLSNAPRRAEKAKAVLENLGFSENLYDKLITSGEVTFNYVKANSSLGKNYIYIGPEKDRHLLDNLGLNIVESATQADFALATGFEAFGSLFSEKQAQLDDCLAYQLPLLVANPDRLVVKQTGEEQICAGLMGEYYAKNGGEVIYFGKPYINAYSYCLEFFKTADNSKILGIGDSFHTDVAGANNIGASSLFVAGGIFKRDIFENEKISKQKLKNIISLEKHSPTYVIDEFRW